MLKWQNINYKLKLILKVNLNFFKFLIKIK